LEQLKVFYCVFRTIKKVKRKGTGGMRVRSIVTSTVRYMNAAKRTDLRVRYCNTLS